jgi:hypothetical protein
MDIHDDNTPDEEGSDESPIPAFEFWSDEGAQRYNDMLDEGGAYVSSGARLSEDFETYDGEEEREYVDPELYDKDEETLSPGDIELIFENSYLM